MGKSEISESASSGANPKRPELEKVHPSELLEFATIHSSGTIGTFQAPKSEQGQPQSPQVENEEQINITQSNDDLFHGLSAAIPGLRRLSVEARNATEAERKVTFLRGCKLYPKAIGWSVLLSLTIVMEGFGTTLIASFFAFPIFRRAYGTPADPTRQSGHLNYQISASWQSGLQNGAVASEIIGLFFNGLLTERFGYHKTMVGSLIWMCLFVFLFFFAFNIQMLLAAQVLCGLTWGIFQTLSTTYAAEIMPITLRAYLLSNVNMCWLVGQVCGVGALRGLVELPSQWSYRIPFALQWVFAVPILVGSFFAPESPWWLIRHERTDEARKALLRLTRRDGGEFNVDEAIAMLKHTNEVEKHLSSSGVSYIDCFKGTNLRRTEIACMVWTTQALCGSSLTGYAAYYYEQAGFSTANSFNLAVGMYGLAIVGGIISWTLLPKFGRRTLYLWGLVGCLVVLLVAGAISSSVHSQGSSWAIGSLLIVLTMIYDITIGPVCYVLVAEIPSTRLRVKTVVLARVIYNCASLVTNVITPRMLNPLAWNLKGQSCYVFAGTTVLCLIWCYFRLPEPLGLSYLELDILFEKRAKAKKFREFQVNLASTGYFSLTRNERSGSAWRGY